MATSKAIKPIVSTSPCSAGITGTYMARPRFLQICWGFKLRSSRLHIKHFLKKYIYFYLINMDVCLHTCLYTTCHKRVSDHQEMELQMVIGPPYRCWESHPDPLEEWPLILTTRPSFQLKSRSLLIFVILFANSWNYFLSH